MENLNKISIFAGKFQLFSRGRRKIEKLKSWRVEELKFWRVEELKNWNYEDKFIEGFAKEGGHQAHWTVGTGWDDPQESWREQGVQPAPELSVL